MTIGHAYIARHESSGKTFPQLWIFWRSYINWNLCNATSQGPLKPSETSKEKVMWYFTFMAMVAKEIEFHHYAWAIKKYQSKGRIPKLRSWQWSPISYFYFDIKYRKWDDALSAHNELKFLLTECFSSYSFLIKRKDQRYLFLL